MLKKTLGRAKLLILMSSTYEEADKEVVDYLKERFPYKVITTREKIAFLLGMFDVQIIDSQPNDSDEMTYAVLISGIINSKYY